MESNFFWYFPASALVNTITSGLLGIYLLLIASKRPVARYLLYFCLAATWWGLGYFFWQISSTAESALFWTRFLMFGAIFSSVCYFHLVIVFLNKQHTYFKYIVGLFYLSCIIFAGLNLTPNFVIGVEPRSYFRFWPIPGQGYMAFLAVFFLQVLLASVLLFKKYRASSGVEKIQTALLLAGILLAFVGGSTNYFLWYNIPIPPWGNGLVAIYVVLTVYAMLKYRFMDLKVVFAEIFTGLILLVFLLDIFLSRSYLEIGFRVLALFIMFAFGYVLIRSVQREIQRREEVTALAHDLQEANNRLQELDRQKTEFLSIASHQLRTPLSIINGYIGLLQEGGYGKPTKDMQQVFANMDESNTRLTKLVDEFLDITRIEQGRTKFYYSPHDMNEIVDSVIKELRGRAEQKGLALLWKRDYFPHVASVDDEKIRHAIYNLVDNAVKYSEHGTITVALQSKDGGLVFTVNDQGLGFEEKDRVNLYQKFYRGENVQHTNVNGTGLGLYVVSKFVDAHGGRVWAKSPGLGKGSEFGFWIPLDRDARKSEVVENPVLAQGSGGR